MYKLQQQPFISFCLMFNMYIYITITIIISIIVLNCMGKLYTFPLISFSNISIKNLTLMLNKAKVQVKDFIDLKSKIWIVIKHNTK